MTTSTSTERPIAMLEDQSVAFVELFFDLVFVFSVTQVVGILHHGFNWTSIGQAMLVFWLVWWAWTDLIRVFTPVYNSKLLRRYYSTMICLKSATSSFATCACFLPM